MSAIILIVAAALGVFVDSRAGWIALGVYGLVLLLGV